MKSIKNYSESRMLNVVTVNNLITCRITEKQTVELELEDKSSVIFFDLSQYLQILSTLKYFSINNGFNFENIDKECLEIRDDVMPGVMYRNREISEIALYKIFGKDTYRLYFKE